MRPPIQVLIAGAGPTGLAAALFLARAGVSVRIVDPLEQPIATSKALGVNPRTLNLLEETGVTAAILAEARVMRGLSIHRRGRPLAEIALNGSALGAKHPMVILSQARTEALMAAALAEQGVAVERGVAVQSLTQAPDAVTARLSDGSDMTIPVLFAADGAHSSIRKTLDLDFPGDVWDEPWRLIDVDLTGPPPDRGWIDLQPSGPFVCLPFSGGVFRLIGPGPDLLERLPDGWRAGTVRWRSDFRISHRMVERMTVGRVCLGGDAAHIHSPIGARGMNLGVEDAYVFAACTADFLNGEPGRLDDYGRLRQAVDAAVVRNVRRLTGLVRDASPAADLARRLLLPMASHLPLAVDRALKVGLGLDHPTAVR